MKSLALSLIVLAFSASAMAAEPNPYLPDYPFTTARITYTHADGKTEMLYIKGHAQHSYDEPNGDFHLKTPTEEYNVLVDRKQLIGFVPPARMFRNFYATLSDAEKATVQANLVKIGPHIKLYGETGVKKLPGETIAGKPAECYDYGIMGMKMEECFWYGITLRYSSDYLANYAATRIELDVPLDDALFTAPAYPVDPNDGVGSAITARYATIFTKLKKPDFTIEDGLDTRYWLPSDEPDKALIQTLMK